MRWLPAAVLGILAAAGCAERASRRSTEGAVEMFRTRREKGGAGALGNQDLLIGPWGQEVLQQEDPGTPLRLAISSSSFDRFDVNPNTGEPYGDRAVTRKLLAERLKAALRRGEPGYDRARVATNCVWLDRARPKRVVLPAIAR